MLDCNDLPPSYIRYLESVERNRKRKKEYARKYSKELYEKRKALGVCTRCGRELALNGYVLCWECRLWSNQIRSGYTGYKPRKPGKKAA